MGGGGREVTMPRRFFPLLCDVFAAYLKCRRWNWLAEEKAPPKQFPSSDSHAKCIPRRKKTTKINIAIPENLLPDLQPVFPRCADTCPSSLSAPLTRDPFCAFALQPRPRSQPPAPAFSSRRARQIHQISQQDIDNQASTDSPAPETLDSRGPLNGKLSPNSARLTGASPHRSPSRRLFFLSRWLRNERKEIQITHCKGFSGFLHAISPTAKAEDENTQPRSPCQKNSSAPVIPHQAKGGFPQCNCRGRSFLA